jgi:hypothetical protein
LVDAGTSTNETRLGLLGPIAGSWPAIMANPKVEVDAGEGFSTLAVVLQYEGVVHLAGITAALKLPSGFKAQLPLIDDLNNYNIALSSYRGHIYPSQGIVLYFSLDVTTNAKVQSPGLGILALHFLRSDQISIIWKRTQMSTNWHRLCILVWHKIHNNSPYLMVAIVLLGDTVSILCLKRY